MVAVCTRSSSPWNELAKPLPSVGWLLWKKMRPLMLTLISCAMGGMISVERTNIALSTVKPPPPDKSYWQMSPCSASSCYLTVFPLSFLFINFFHLYPSVLMIYGCWHSPSFSSCLLSGCINFMMSLDKWAWLDSVALFTSGFSIRLIGRAISAKKCFTEDIIFVTIVTGHGLHTEGIFRRWHLSSILTTIWHPSWMNVTYKAAHAALGASLFIRRRALN